MMNGMNRRDFLKATSVSVGAFAFGGKLMAAKAAKPNVILVMTDDQGYGDVGALGNRDIKTPALDALYKESVRLTDYHVDPTCSPTRSALMTGRYSSRTGVWHTIMGRSIMHRDEVTMGDVFSASGYSTGFFGKWHLGDNYPFRPQDRGFGEVLAHGGGGVGQTPDYWDNDYFDDTYFHNGKAKKYEGYCTDIWFDGAMKFIEDNKDKPFFCYIPTNAPHGPFNVADEYRDLYKDNPNVANASFTGMITNIDENMAKLIKHLDKLKLADNTILIFTTDNGTAAGVRFDKDGKVSSGFNAGMRGQKGSEYDGGHRVPFFVRWPEGGIGGGRDVNPITAHVDVLPTLIDLCDLETPDVDFDGTSIAPLLSDSKGSWQGRTLFVHSQRIENPVKWRKCAVMTDRWRLVNGTQLFDMEADPGQRNNVVSGNGALVEKMRAEYDDWWESISTRFDDYCHIVIGSDKENPSRITCHDWHGPSVPWNHGHIRRGITANGFWAIDVDRAGTYDFALRRWPEEIGEFINGSPAAGGKAINARLARLQIGGMDMTKTIAADDTAVLFRMRLKKGKTQMKTWFTDKDGTSRGAYFVYVTRVTEEAANARKSKS